MRKPHLVIMLSIAVFFSCGNSSPSEIDAAKKWQYCTIWTRIIMKKSVSVENKPIPEAQQAKYIKLLERKSYTVIDCPEYQELYGQVPAKRYAIAFRAITPELVDASELRMWTWMNEDARTIIAMAPMLFDILPGEEDKYSLHRVVLTMEVDFLPKTIYVY